MRREDVLAFVRRDWAAVAEGKAAFWAERKGAMSADDMLALGDGLRRHAQAVKPDWPDATERADDFTAHCRVSEALRAVARHRLR
ncbi:MAG: hypothetical protein H0X67_22190 [Acidobacteria bacterium]|nr:hypothetical protein [Acidobacteriota bacterium]